MSLILGQQVETAFSFVDVLSEGVDIENEIDITLSGEFNSKAEQALDRMRSIERIANGTWARRLINSELAEVIQSYLKGAQLVLRRNPFSGETALVTPGVLNELRNRVAATKRQSIDSSDGAFDAITQALYEEVVREGIVEWALRSEGDDYEVRRCAYCGKWFEPQLKGRSRFCSVKCRKGFNNLRSSDGDASSFGCALCLAKKPMDEFSGLTSEDPEGKTATPLRMGRYSPRANNLCCVSCVRESHPEWRRYLAPMESLAERAS